MAASSKRRTPLMAGNWKMNLNHQEAVVLVQKLAWTLRTRSTTTARSRSWCCRRSPTCARVQTLVDGDRLLDQVRRPGRLDARRRRVHRRDLGGDAGQARLLLRRRRSLRAPASTTARPTRSSTPRRTRRSPPGMTPIVCVGEGLEVRQAGEHVAHTPRPARRLAGGLHRRAGRRPGRRLRAGLGDRHRRGGHARRTRRRSARRSGRGSREIHGDAAADARTHPVRRIGEGGERRRDHGAARRRRRLVGGASLQADEFGGICRFYDMPVL